jgi:hypothetical protein
MISSAQLKNTVTRFRVLENFLKTVTEVVLPFINRNINNILMQWIAYLKTRPFCFAKCQSISALKLSYHEHRKKSIDNFTQITYAIFSTKKAANTIRNVPPQQGMHSYAKVVDKSAGIYSNHL